MIDSGHSENICGEILRIEGGSFRYKGGPKILDDINAGVKPGEILAVLGPNGAGKTTMLRCMMDMLHWDSGRSLLGGEDIRRMPASKLWRRMAYVPQARTAAASYTVFETVLLGRSSRIGAFAAPSGEDMAICERVLKRLGIYGLADKPCSSISGGEFQMALIARAMAAEADVLVLDEPESNLDFRNQLVVLDTISALASEGVACIFNTHYPSHALRLADKSLLLFRNDGGAASADGRSDGNTRSASLFGSTSQVVTEDNIRKAFGVNAVIGEVETDENILRSVMPVSLDPSASGAGAEREGNGPEETETPERTDIEADRLAAITVIMETNEHAGRVNALLSEYEQLIIGRMGQPYKKKGLYIISVNLDGPADSIDELSHRLGILPGISVKTTYASVR